jgi:hypothetical protein
MLTRRQITTGLVLAAAVPRRAVAQAFPARPIKLILPHPAGGGTEATAHRGAGDDRAAETGGGRRRARFTKGSRSPRQARRACRRQHAGGVRSLHQARARALEDLAAAANIQIN